MNGKQQRILLSFRRVTTFVDVRPQLTAAGSSEGAALLAQVNALKSVIDRVTAHAVAQRTFAAATTRAASDEPAIKKLLLEHHLGSIVKVARGLRGSVPGIGVLKKPRGNLRNAALIEAATAFANQAAIYSAVLADHGLPADFIAQLRAAIASFRASIDARGTARTNLRGASNGVEQEIALGRRIISVLDGVIPRLLRAEPNEIAVWRAAKRVERGATVGQSIALPDWNASSAGQASSPPVQPPSPGGSQAA
jgi:hypothetical protein